MNQFRFSTLPIRQHRLRSFVWILLIVIMPIGASRAPGAGHAVLEVPLSVQVRTPGDGSIKKNPGGKISRRTNRFEMPAGDQIVEMRYHEVGPDNSIDDHEVAKSKVKKFTIDARAGVVYRVAYPTPASHEEARGFAQDPILLIETVEEGSAAVPSMPAPIVPEPTPVKLPATSVARPDLVAGPADDPAVELPGSGVSPFELMQFWWKQANPTERKRFLNGL
jgi:hypothetical protein